MRQRGVTVGRVRCISLPMSALLTTSKTRGAGDAAAWAGELVARGSGAAWFFLPTLGYVEYEDGERAFALVWLQLEVGVRWRP